MKTIIQQAKLVLGALVSRGLPQLLNPVFDDSGLGIIGTDASSCH
jgi:hypothetical protein